MTNKKFPINYRNSKNRKKSTVDIIIRISVTQQAKQNNVQDGTKVPCGLPNFSFVTIMQVQATCAYAIIMNNYLATDIQNT